MDSRQEHALEYIHEVLYPQVDFAESMIYHDDEEASLDVDIFAAFAVRLFYQGWPAKDLSDLVLAVVTQQAEYEAAQQPAVLS